MALCAINYDLTKPGQNYENLIEAIKAYPNWAHVLKSSWLVVSNSTATQIANDLLKHIDANDKLLVTRITNDVAWYGLDDEVSAWLKQVYAA